jgi:hypothetical protein
MTVISSKAETYVHQAIVRDKKPDNKHTVKKYTCNLETTSLAPSFTDSLILMKLPWNVGMA